MKNFIQENPDFSKYRQSAGCVVLNPEGKVLYCERADLPGAWQLPQGGIDAGEAPEKAALRELFEETGIKDVTLKDQYPNWLVYDFPPGAHRRDGATGQAQKWFLLHFHGTEVDLTKAQDQEFLGFQWATPEYILKTVTPFRKPIYEECFKYFGLLEG